MYVQLWRFLAFANSSEILHCTNMFNFCSHVCCHRTCDNCDSLLTTFAFPHIANGHPRTAGHIEGLYLLGKRLNSYLNNKPRGCLPFLLTLGKKLSPTNWMENEANISCLKKLGTNTKIKLALNNFIACNFRLFSQINEAILKFNYNFLNLHFQMGPSLV